MTLWRLAKKFKKRIIFGILVGLAWGLDSVLMGIVGKNEIFDGLRESAFVNAFFHDGFCFIWLTIILLIGKDFKNVINLIKTKKGKITMMAALIGAPIAMSSYLLGIKYASPAYASSISVIYPGIGAVMSYFILKEKLSLRAIIGIILSLGGSVALGYSKIDMSVYPDFYKGIGFEALAAIGWASEGVIIGFAMKKIKVKDKDDENIKPIHFLTVRYLVSLTAYGVISLPFIKGYGLVGEVIKTGTVISFAGIAVLGVITYLSWYKAVDLIGAAMGTALNSTAAFWAVIFSGLIMGQKITPYLGFWCFVIVLGVMIFAIDPKEFSKKNK